MRIGWVVLAGAERRPAGLVEQRDAAHGEHHDDAATDEGLRHARGDGGADQRAGDGAEHERDEDAPVEAVERDVGDRGGHHERDGLDEVGADEPHGGQAGVEHQQRDHDDRAGADAGDADEQAAQGADEQRGDRADGGVVVGVVAAADAQQVEVEAQGVRRCREQQGEADAELERVVDVLGLDDPRDEVRAEQGHRDRPDHQPLGELHVGRALALVHDRAAGLVDRGRGEVGRDDRRRLADAEEDQRRASSGRRRPCR